jgi:FAD/FMN-containing dehydrogenase
MPRHAVSVARVTDLSLATGTVVRPGDDEWDAARTFHSGIGEPTVVVRASSVADVCAALRYAASERLDVMIRGGGHSAWGAVPGGLMLDLGAIDDVRIEGTTVSAAERPGVRSRGCWPTTGSP